MIVVTHYQRLLNYIVPDFVHVLSRRADREVRRQGTGAANWKRAATPGWASRTKRRRSASMTAVAEQIGAVAGGVHEPAGGRAMAAGAARSRVPALRGAGLPHHARRRVALHQRRADRAHAVSRRRSARTDRCVRCCRKARRPRIAELASGALRATSTEQPVRRAEHGVPATSGPAPCCAFRAGAVRRRADRDHLRGPARSSRPEPRSSATRATLILVGADAQCTIVETYAGAAALTSPTPSPKSWPAKARWSITTSCRRESRRSLPRRHHAGAARPQRQFHLALHFAGRRAGPQRRQRRALGRHRGTLNGLYLVERHAARRQSHGHRPRQAARHQPRAVQGHSGRQVATRSSTARSSSARTRRRPTPSRPTRTWCCPKTPSSTPSRSCRS